MHSWRCRSIVFPCYSENSLTRSDLSLPMRMVAVGASTTPLLQTYITGTACLDNEGALNHDKEGDSLSEQHFLNEEQRNTLDSLLRLVRALDYESQQSWRLCAREGALVQRTASTGCDMPSAGVYDRMAHRQSLSTNCYPTVIITATGYYLHICIPPLHALYQPYCSSTGCGT